MPENWLDKMARDGMSVKRHCGHSTWDIWPTTGSHRRLAGAIGVKNKAPDGDLIISVRGLRVI